MLRAGRRVCQAEDNAAMSVSTKRVRWKSNVDLGEVDLFPSLHRAHPQRVGILEHVILFFLATPCILPHFISVLRGVQAEP
jgi:hypothetical protein